MMATRSAGVGIMNPWGRDPVTPATQYGSGKTPAGSLPIHAGAPDFLAPVADIVTRTVVPVPGAVRTSQ